jgi:carbohydrate-selective porin (OprB family)
MLRPPPNGPGTALRVTVGDWRYGFGVHGLDDVDGDQSGLPFVIGEVGYRNIFALNGHYRLWARVASVREDRDRVTWGAGVSFDQLLTSTLGVFFRAGVSRDQGESLTSHAWSVGFQLTPTWFDRGNDALGVGYSDQREPDGRERVVEAYYRFAMAEWLSLNANVQWVVSGPNTVTGGINRNVVVPGLRAVLSF